MGRVARQRGVRLLACSAANQGTAGERVQRAALASRLTNSQADLKAALQKIGKLEAGSLEVCKRGEKSTMTELCDAIEWMARHAEKTGLEAGQIRVSSVLLRRLVTLVAGLRSGA